MVELLLAGYLRDLLKAKIIRVSIGKGKNNMEELLTQLGDPGNTHIPAAYPDHGFGRVKAGSSDLVIGGNKIVEQGNTVLRLARQKKEVRALAVFSFFIPQDIVAKIIKIAQLAQAWCRYLRNFDRKSNTMQQEILWRSLEDQTLEHCTIKTSATGTGIRSVIAGQSEGRLFHVFYTITLDAGWHTRAFTIESQVDGKEWALKFRKEDKGIWTCKGRKNALSGTVSISIFPLRLLPIPCP